jgi:hypothetical protein
MRTSDCYNCHANKENPDNLLCNSCQKRDGEIAAQIELELPTATPDQKFYLKREAMKAEGWHSRKDWTDPRGFNGHTANRPS